jgi:hypothetical protein
MSSYKQAAQFSSLPQEIWDQIWNLTLPSRRIFDLDKSHGAEQHADVYTFKNTYPVPSALQTCRGSRETALRQGFFLAPPHSNKSVYFIPETDILYFGRVECQRLKEKELIDMPGLDRVLNFGFEWASFFEYDPNKSIVPARRYWRTVVENLYVQMPHLKTLNHISPVPIGKLHREFGLIPLRERSRVSWQGTDDEDEKGGAFVAARWRDVKPFIEKALQESERRPEILGWGLHPSSTRTQILLQLSKPF